MTVVASSGLLSAPRNETTRGNRSAKPGSSPNLPAVCLGLGVISYSFYLWHLTVTQMIAQSHNSAAFSASGLGLLDHVHTARPVVLFAVALVATAVLATATYRLVELPFLKRKG